MSSNSPATQLELLFAQAEALLALSFDQTSKMAPAFQQRTSTTLLVNS